MDILDVALFDEPEGNSVATTGTTTPTIARWLFTAKDGRVMKKAANNATLGALKQALLGRVLRVVSDGDGGSAGRIFATALLASGENVPLDEDTWDALVIGGGIGDRVAAVTALFTGDPAESRRECPRQRVTCEYRTKADSTASARADGSFGMPIQASMTTWIVVSPGLLREAEGMQNPQDLEQAEHEKTSALAGRGATNPDGRLISRVKSTNREVEAKLRSIVQWVQEVRRVRVLSMTAIFTVVPSPGAGACGVWLEQALDVRVVPQQAKMMTAPITGPHGILSIVGKIPVDAMVGQFPGAGERQHSIENNFPGGKETGWENPSVDGYRKSSETDVKTRQEGGHSGGSPEETVLANAATKRPASVIPCSPNSERKSLTLTASSSAESPASESINPMAGTTSTETTAADAAAAVAASAAPIDVLLAVGTAAAATAIAPNAFLSAVGGRPRSQHTEDGERGVPYGGSGACSKVSLDASADAKRQRGRSSVGAAVSRPGHHAGKKCAGNFCAFKATSELSAGHMQKRKKNGGDSKAEGLDWTSISAPKEGSALLEFSRPTSPAGLGNHGVSFSLTFKSVGLARMEAERGQDAYWGEPLRNCWREGLGQKAGLQGLDPSEMYEEVSEVQCYCRGSNHGVALPGLVH